MSIMTLSAYSIVCCRGSCSIWFYVISKVTVLLLGTEIN